MRITWFIHVNTTLPQYLVMDGEDEIVGRISRDTQIVIPPVMVSRLTRLEDPRALHPRNSTCITPPDSRVCVSFFPAQLVIRPVMRVARLVYGDTVVAGGVSSPGPSELFRPGGKVSSTAGQDKYC